MSEQNRDTQTLFNSEYVNKGKTSKVRRYGWTYKDAPGRFMDVDKNMLNVDDSYQRSHSTEKVLELASNWSFVACGSICVGEREDGSLWVIDGQHRVIAARKRHDIKTLPCLVFETTGSQEEAKGFLNTNANRKPISSISQFKAAVTAGDEIAIFVKETLDRLGIKMSTGDGKRTMKSVRWALDKAKRDKPSFVAVMELLAMICADCHIPESLLDGIYYIHRSAQENSVANGRLKDRMIRVGAERLHEGAKRAAAFYVKGGAAVWAEGILHEVNKGLREKDRFAISKPTDEQ